MECGCINIMQRSNLVTCWHFWEKIGDSTNMQRNTGDNDLCFSTVFVVKLNWIPIRRLARDSLFSDSRHDREQHTRINFNIMYNHYLWLWEPKLSKQNNILTIESRWIWNHLCISNDFNPVKIKKGDCSSTLNVVACWRLRNNARDENGTNEVDKLMKKDKGQR